MEVMFNPSSHVVYSPKNLPEYYSSAPTTPAHHLSHFYPDFHDIQENPLTKTPVINVDDDDDDSDDFTFDVNENWEKTSTSAEELFVGGVIKSIKQPPKVNVKESTLLRQKTMNDTFIDSAQNGTKRVAPTQRGRKISTKSSSMRRTARSLSPLRNNQRKWEEEETEENGCSHGCTSAVKAKKWRLKDLFLFRSASEGRAADKDPLKKYTATPGSSWRRRKLPVSPHELHYTMNRAASNDLKKKTFLPYKEGILGRLAFNPAVHALANGFGFSRN